MRRISRIMPLPSRARSLIFGTATKEPEATPWWNGAIAAWQAAGADSSDAAKLDLTGNGNHLTGFTPTWDVDNGWTTYDGSDYMDLLTGGEFAIVWMGKFANAASQVECWGNPSGWTGGLGCHSYNSPSRSFYVGCNAARSDRIETQKSAYFDYPVIVFYLKHPDLSQTMDIFYGTTISERDTLDKYGTVYTQTQIALYTNGAGICKAAAVYNTTSINTSEIASKMRSL